MNTPSWTVIVDDPQLRMDLEGVEDDIDILSLAIFQLLKYLDLVDGDFDGIILGTSIDFVVRRVDIDNLQGNNTLLFFIKTIPAGTSQYLFDIGASTALVS